jgi:hypothetical protein
MLLLNQSGFVEWVDGAIPLSKIISDYNTTTQVLAKVNLDCKKATMAEQAISSRSDPVFNNNIGIAYNARRSSTRALRRLCSAESRDYDTCAGGDLSADNIPEKNNDGRGGLSGRRSDSFSGSGSEDEADGKNERSKRERGRERGVEKEREKEKEKRHVFLDLRNERGNHHSSSSSSSARPSKEIDSPIHNFLRCHHPSSSFYDLYGIESSVMHSYVSTVAGSCVLTYILGKCSAVQYSTV